MAVHDTLTWLFCVAFNSYLLLLSALAFFKIYRMQQVRRRLKALGIEGRKIVNQQREILDQYRSLYEEASGVTGIIEREGGLHNYKKAMDAADRTQKFEAVKKVLTSEGPVQAFVIVATMVRESSRLALLGHKRRMSIIGLGLKRNHLEKVERELDAVSDNHWADVEAAEAEHDYIRESSPWEPYCFDYRRLISNGVRAAVS